MVTLRFMTNEEKKYAACARMGATIAAAILGCDDKAVVDKAEAVFRLIQKIDDPAVMAEKLKELVKAP